MGDENAGRIGSLIPDAGSRPRPALRPVIIAATAAALAGIGALAYAAQVAVARQGLIVALTAAIAGVVAAIATAGRQTRYEREALASRSADFAGFADEVNRRISDLEAAVRLREQMLGAVPADLFTIDAAYGIGSRYANVLGGILERGAEAGETFLDLLRRLLPAEAFPAARDFAGALFDVTKDEDEVLGSNPLLAVEASVAQPDGSEGVRYLAFDFRRIVENGAVVRVLVTIEDVTQRTLAERSLRESAAERTTQFEFVMGMLLASPAEIDRFIALACEQLAVADRSLKASDFASESGTKTAVLRQRLDVVLQAVRAIGEGASAVRLERFERRAQDFERTLVGLKVRATLGGDDFLTIVMGLDELNSDLDELQALREKLPSLGALDTPLGVLDPAPRSAFDSAPRNALEFAPRVEVPAPEPADAGDEVVAGVGALAKMLAAQFGKDVAVDAAGFDSRSLPPSRRIMIEDVLMQLTRNSVTHGIEPPEERDAAHKPRIGKIEIRSDAAAPPGAFAFTFRDDGRGLDTAKIRERALAVGVLAPERAHLLDDAEVAALIFQPGFTTDLGTTYGAPRGMGMSVVKSRIVDESGGEIAIDSEPGRYCEFSFVVPVGAAV